MRAALLCFLTAIPFLIFGQETKKVNDKETNEVYYVLKSNNSIKHGRYQKYSYKGTIEIIGFFKYDLKDSIWEFYNYDGELEQKFDFTHNSIIYYKIDDKDKEMTFKVIRGSDTTLTKLERPPLYIGGSMMMLEPIWKNIDYPQIAKELGISGEVLVTFTIDRNGKTSNHHITKRIGGGCDEEALRVIKLIPDNWLPGLLDGVAVDVEFTKPIRYTLN